MSIAAVSVAAIALAGCVAAPHPSSRTSTVPAATSTPTSTPSPAPSLVRGPNPKVDCADLASAVDVSSAVGYDVEPIESPGLDAAGGTIESLHWLQVVGFQQAGGSWCQWAGAGDGSFDVKVLPDTSTWAGGDPSGRARVSVPAIGDAAYGGCSSQVGGASCQYDVRVGEVWIEITASGDVMDHQDAVGALVVHVAAEVKAAGPPRPRWAPETGPRPTCDDLAAGSMLPAVGQVASIDDSPLDPITAEGMRVAGVSSCSWGGTGPSRGLVVAVAIPDAVDTWTMSPPVSNGSLVYEPFGGLGSVAASGCAAVVDECAVQAISGHWRVGVLYGGNGAGLNGTVDIAKAVIAKLG
jgi:hypothetical protein